MKRTTMREIRRVAEKKQLRSTRRLVLTMDELKKIENGEGVKKELPMMPWDIKVLINKENH